MSNRVTITPQSQGDIVYWKVILHSGQKYDDYLAFQGYFDYILLFTDTQDKIYVKLNSRSATKNDLTSLRMIKNPYTNSTWTKLYISTDTALSQDVELLIGGDAGFESLAFQLQLTQIHQKLSNIESINTGIKTQTDKLTFNSFSDLLVFKRIAFSPAPNVKDLSVGTTAIQIDSSTSFYKILILADDSNSDVIYVGNSTNQLFPLKPGASLEFYAHPSNVYVRANSGTQMLHVFMSGYP